MFLLPPNTVSKLYYFDNRIKNIYENHGFTSIPFNGSSLQGMIGKSRNEIAVLFERIWGSSMGYHLLGTFYAFKGNILEFYMSLDEHNRQLFSGKDW